MTEYWFPFSKRYYYVFMGGLIASIAAIMISDLEEILQEVKGEKYVECYLFDGMIGCSHLKSESCDHACHLNQMESK